MNARQSSGSGPRQSSGARRELNWLFGVWALLCIGTVLLARQNLAAPGLYYDEAVFAGLARDFITGRHRLHTPGFELATIFGRPFPVFVQFYLGALKSWLVMPSLAVFGCTVAVVRLTSLCWALLALLFFMLAVRRWLGLAAAVLAGAVLAIDPTFFFLGVIDWGGTISSLLCRCIAFYFAVLWWQSRRAGFLFVAALFLGLGFFNKVDFAAVIIGSGIAAVLFYGNDLWKAVRSGKLLPLIFIVGLLTGAGPMTLKLPHILSYTSAGKGSTGPTEWSEKFHTVAAMYDGSYFDRLMKTGGVFETMYLHPASVHSLLWLFLAIAILSLLVVTISDREKQKRRVAGILLISFALTTLCALLIPGAVRIHHTVLAFPHPQMIIATAAAFFWNKKPSSPRWSISNIVVAAGLVVLFVSQLRVITQTEKFLTETGGRGRWSNALDQFCAENVGRTNLTIVSLDWGFNEQVAFLTDGPQLVETVWALQTIQGALPALPRKPQNIYLAHSPEYSLYRFDLSYLEAAQNDSAAEIKPYLDRSGHVAFYTIRFPGP